ncbi:MAG: hypothetical protein J3K34DRAFT_521224 [Monoraphidium minutum]|nr:MAG: hypothetical protein J3K34DRAFT_521224 [Monoraphidium minutum]
MRQAYGAHGVVGYYQQEGTSYRNPHTHALGVALSAALSEVFGGDQQERLLSPVPAPAAPPAEANVLRLSGARRQGQPDGGGGGGGGGGEGGGDLSLRLLDLACGSGEAAIAVAAWLNAAAPRFGRLVLTAADPYTAGAFRAHTGLPRVEPWSFEDVQGGALEGRSYDAVAVSFALHLLDESRLYATLSALSAASRWLFLLSPHKRPHVKDGCGWALVHSSVRERVHVRFYESCNVAVAPAAGCR